MVMIIPFPLDIVFEFLKPILSDSLKDRLKSKGSVEIAKERAFNLYKALMNVNIYTEKFVDHLLEFYESVAASEDRSTIALHRVEMIESAESLMILLKVFAENLQEVNPQLEIHQYEVVHEFDEYSGRRGLLLMSIVNPGQIDVDNLAELQQIVTQAKENQLLIRKATGEFRDFLKKEFDFKNSF